MRHGICPWMGYPAMPLKKNMMNYWEQKEKNKTHAWALTEALKRKASGEIDRAVQRTKLYWENQEVPDVQPEEGRQGQTEVSVVQSTTVDAAFTEAEADGDACICLLNFASYKEPGGMFLQGSMAQEESLCHASVLYPVLSSPRVMGMFYQKHGNRLNRGLYHSDLLYSPDVLFFRDRKGRRFDVITCAAPNKKAAQRYQHVTDQEAEQAMRHRIDSVLYAAWKEKTEVLILGAFGCGVFGNDLGFVSAQFKELLGSKYRGCFHRAVFAVPDEKSFLVMGKILEG